ncbi:TetR/AcrR family transcriptional regulator [Pseudoclavibacter sp. Z016]|uniref:TetR/AcrR family transcriptional regulator n=1 Tax=Pseudoclavibacter sp. Z016 TaxID=2080581 RepID=UPI000CE8D12B|nr:TetR/AcrR family transcriptional regulator [Pseudoclavibacter sp. Z016]PPF78488.1 TetR family transcriptional regulator [Pseudoclavibacter sp. Z016]
MMAQATPPPEEPRKRRLPWDARHQDLLEKALAIVRQDGVDALTLGTLAQHGGVSKPVVYDHFESRSSLLTALYRWIDAERKRAFQEGMAQDSLAHEPTIDALSETYIRCATDASSEFFAVGAAMTGNEERASIYRELEETGVQMFEAILRPHVVMPDPELHLLCIALVGAGESLSASTLKGAITEAEAIATYSQLIGLATRKDSGCRS